MSARLWKTLAVFVYYHYGQHTTTTRQIGAVHDKSANIELLWNAVQRSTLLTISNQPPSCAYAV